MRSLNPSVNDAPLGRWAPITNISLAAGLLEKGMNRAAQLPGLVALYGSSGSGKSMAGAYCANKFGGVYIECRSFFTSKTLMLAIVRELGLHPARTQSDLLDQIAEQLLLSRRPLIIDEVDHIVEGKAIETVRDILEASRGTIMLIGEEQFPRKLARWERMHNRVLVWQPAQPATLSDVRQLARFYAPQVEIGDDLLQRVIDVSRGGIRRCCVNIELIRSACVLDGTRQIGLKQWGDRAFYSGDAPARKV